MEARPLTPATHISALSAEHLPTSSCGCANCYLPVNLPDRFTKTDENHVGSLNWERDNL